MSKKCAIIMLSLAVAFGGFITVEATAAPSEGRERIDRRVAPGDAGGGFRPSGRPEGQRRQRQDGPRHDNDNGREGRRGENRDSRRGGRRDDRGRNNRRQDNRRRDVRGRDDRRHDNRRQDKRGYDNRRNGKHRQDKRRPQRRADLTRQYGLGEAYFVKAIAHHFR